MREMDEKKFKNGEDKAKAFVVVARMAYYVPGISWLFVKPPAPRNKNNFLSPFLMCFETVR